MSLGISVV